MKSKILLFSILSLFIFSCSSDDESSGTPPIPAEEKLLESVKSGGSEVMTLAYNPDKTVKSITFSNYAIFNFNYTAGNIHSITLIGGGDSQEYIFEYQNGKISSFSVDDEVTPVSYNAAENYYLYLNEYNEEFAIEMDADGEIIRRAIYDEGAEEYISSLLFIHEPNKYGAMANSNQVNVHLSMVLEFSWELLGLPLFKKPIKTVSTMEGNFDAVNTFDNQNFLTSISFDVEESLGYEFTYTQLN